MHAETLRTVSVALAANRQVWVVARVGLDQAVSGAQVGALVRAAERAMLRERPYVVRVDLVPVG